MYIAKRPGAFVALLQDNLRFCWSFIVNRIFFCPTKPVSFGDQGADVSGC